MIHGPLSMMANITQPFYWNNIFGLTKTETKHHILYDTLYVYLLLSKYLLFFIDLFTFQVNVSRKKEKTKLTNYIYYMTIAALLVNRALTPCQNQLPKIA